MSGIVDVDDCEKDGVFWFMSYMTITIDGARSAIGSNVYTGAEKPWERITRWNNEMRHARFVLLSFQLCKSKNVQEKHDVEAWRQA